MSTQAERQIKALDAEQQLALENVPMTESMRRDADDYVHGRISVVELRKRALEEIQAKSTTTQLTASQ